MPSGNPPTGGMYGTLSAATDAENIGAHQRRVPGDGGTPVVSDHHRLALAEGGNSADNVADQMADGV